jgi:hypothetical protein
MFSVTFHALLGLALQLTVLAGVLLGLGKLLLFAFVRRPLPHYWYLPFSAVAGLAVVHLAVQAVALAGMASQVGLRALSIGLLLAAVLSWAKIPANYEPVDWAGWRRTLIVALPIAAIACNLFIAAAPSSKIDEIHYHMLAPKRILQDGALVAYLLPYESSALPQMQHQIALSLVHAWGLPDAGNLISVFLNVLLAVFLFFFAWAETRKLGVSLLLASVACVGMHAAVNHTTSGAHALGDLAITLACVALLKPGELTAKIGKWQSMALVALCATVGAATKVSIWPLGLAVTTLFAIRLCRCANPKANLWHIVLAAVSPWIVCQVPLVLFTWVATGSPFGPFFLGSVFGAGPPVEYANVIASARAVNQLGFLQGCLDLIVRLSPIVPLSVLALAWPSGTHRGSRLLLFGLVLFQGILVAFFLPHFARFFSGLLFAPVAALAIALSGSSLLNRIEASAWPLAALLLAPWLAIQIYYTAPFAKTFTGFMSRQEFLERYVALTADYQALDRLLPVKSTLLAEGRIPSFYAPRPVIFTTRDFHRNQPLYLLTFGDPKDPAFSQYLRDKGCQTEVYRNFHATVVAYRTPGRLAQQDVVSVYACEHGGSAVPQAVH